MFSYYGSKSKLLKYYPKPKHSTIIEPFAGSAKYSLKYWEHEIFLMDKDQIIVDLWIYLQNCTAKDISSLPLLKIGDDIREIDGLCREERILLGYGAQAGVARQGNIVTEAGTRNMKTMFSNIIRDLHKIKHWKIICGDYTQCSNQTATWFIDPPYQHGGHKYRFSNKLICYPLLKKWGTERNGQVIICENTKADWISLLPIKRIQGTAQTHTIEAIWTNEMCLIV